MPKLRRFAALAADDPRRKVVREQLILAFSAESGVVLVGSIAAHARLADRAVSLLVRVAWV